jgi:YD repeat-containing protein
VSRLVEKRRTTTVYEGDLTKVTPPAGGTPTTTVTDILGRTVEVRQHTTPSGVDGDYIALRYTYDQRDKLIEVVDPAGNQWTYTYDLRGPLVESSDPDRGVTRIEYNDVRDPVKVTDGRGVTLVTAYDALGRRTELREGSETGPVRAQWKYDRLYTGQALRGQLTEAIRYEPAGSENAYKWQLRTVTARYQPGGINLVVPAVEGAGLAGTWVFGYGYSAYTGAPTTFTFPAAGGLAGETVTVGYDEQTGLPVRLDTNLPGWAAT